jgi:hypothetical protein
MYRLYSSAPDTGEYYARAQAIFSPTGLWAWTAASSVSVAQQGQTIDITVHFPAGETHYMIIRGVRPFTSIQFSNVNQPSDSQFERYDSSGWTYSASEQSLLVKIRHRSAAEHIKITGIP